MNIGGVLVQSLKSQPKENVLIIITSPDNTKLESLLVFQSAKYTNVLKKNVFGHCNHSGVINRLPAAIVTNSTGSDRCLEPVMVATVYQLWVLKVKKKKKL